jgi:hypothetical protein
MLSTKFDHNTGVITSKEGDGKFTFENDTTSLANGEIRGDLTVGGNTTLNGNTTLYGTYLTLGGFVTMTGAKQQIISATTAVSASNSGAMIIATGGSAQTFTLASNTLTPGFNLRFVAGSGYAHSITCATSGKLQGQALTYNNGGVIQVDSISNKTTLTLATTIRTGDWINIVSDGSNYYVTALTYDNLSQA